MIHWAWLILAAMLGGSFGAMMMALFVAGKRSDAAIEESSRTTMNVK